MQYCPIRKRIEQIHLLKSINIIGMSLLFLMITYRFIKKYFFAIFQILLALESLLSQPGPLGYIIFANPDLAG